MIEKIFEQPYTSPKKILDSNIKSVNTAKKYLAQLQEIGIMSPKKIWKKRKKMNTKSWSKIKDEVYGESGTERRDELVRDFESFKIGLMIRQAREDRKMTQDELASLLDKKRT